MTAISIAPGRVRTVAASASGRPGNALNSAGSSAAVQTSAPFSWPAAGGAAAGRVRAKGEGGAAEDQRKGQPSARPRRRRGDRRRGRPGRDAGRRSDDEGRGGRE